MSCSANAIYIGSRPTVRMTFTDTDDALVDPSDITVRVKSPSRIVTEYVSPDATITQDSLGVWLFQFPDGLAEAGDYWIYILGSGGGADQAAEIKITVRGSHVPPP